LELTTFACTLKRKQKIVNTLLQKLFLDSHHWTCEPQRILGQREWKKTTTTTTTTTKSIYSGEQETQKRKINNENGGKNISPSLNVGAHNLY
jgi:hypothetical protein